MAQRSAAQRASARVWAVETGAARPFGSYGADPRFLELQSEAQTVGLGIVENNEVLADYAQIKEVE